MCVIQQVRLTTKVEETKIRRETTIETDALLRNESQNSWVKHFPLCALNLPDVLPALQHIYTESGLLRGVCAYTSFLRFWGRGGF